MATANPPETMVPVEAVDDVASPLAPKLAIPLTDSVLPRLAAPVTPMVVPTYNALAIAAPPSDKIPPDTEADDASPVAEKVAIPDTPSVELSDAAPVKVDEPPIFRFVPT